MVRHLRAGVAAASIVSLIHAVHNERGDATTVRAIRMIRFGGRQSRMHETLETGVGCRARSSASRLPTPRVHGPRAVLGQDDRTSFECRQQQGQVTFYWDIIEQLLSRMNTSRLSILMTWESIAIADPQACASHSVTKDLFPSRRVLPPQCYEVCFFRCLCIVSRRPVQSQDHLHYEKTLASHATPWQRGASTWSPGPSPLTLGRTCIGSGHRSLPCRMQTPTQPCISPSQLAGERKSSVS